MKKIHLINDTSPDKSSVYTEQKRYRIFLGNGLTFYYSTKKDFTYAMAEINRNLNIILFELNEMWIYCFSEYRRLWYYMPDLTFGSDEATILELDKDLNRNFQLASQRSKLTNGNVFTFKSIYAIIECLHKELKIFLEIRKARKHYLDCNLLDSKIRHLISLRNQTDSISVTPKYSNKKDPQKIIKKNSFHKSAGLPKSQ